MGFIPLPLGVVMIRVVMQSLRITGPVSVLLVILAYACLFTTRIVNNIVILGKACFLIHHHQHVSLHKIGGERKTLALEY